MPKPIVKITVTGEGVSDYFVVCDISSNDHSWHGLKELERAGLFQTLMQACITDKKNSKKMFGSIEFQDAPYLGGLLKPHAQKPTALNLEINKDITVGELIKFFNKIGFTAVVTDKYSLSHTVNTTMGDYDTHAEAAWFNQINTEEFNNSVLRNQLALGLAFPDIQTYQMLYAGTADTPKTMQRLTKHGDNWQTTFKSESAVEHAIMDAINRIEEFDDHGNRPTCPITLDPFEGHNQVILILSKHPSDGTMHADFVHAKMRDRRKKVDVAEYLQKTLKKNPATNDPIVAMESGTLDELKEKYRITRPLRPAI